MPNTPIDEHSEEFEQLAGLFALQVLEADELARFEGHSATCERCQLMVRLAENQLELKPSLTRLANVAESSLGQDDVLRGHLRNIEIYLARLAEDVSQGRGEATQEIRSEIRLLARTIAALAEEERS